MPGEITHDAGIATAASTTSPKLAQPDLSSMGDAAQSPYIPQGSQDSCDSRTKCCYGRESCAWLRHSNELVEDLERDVVRAGKEGQVCGAFSFGLGRYSVVTVLGDSLSWMEWYEASTMMSRPQDWKSKGFLESED